MQSSLNELAELLAERAGRQFDFSFRQELKVMINYWRVRLIVDSLNSRPNDRKWFSKWLELSLIEVNFSQFPDFPECPIMRTEFKIPKSIRANGKLYDFSGKLNKMTVISVHEPYEIKVLMSGRFTGSYLRMAVINDYGFVFNALNLPGISIKLIPEDIQEFQLAMSQSLSPVPCFTDDEPYFVTEDLKQRIVQAIIATEFRMPAIPETKLQEIQINNERNLQQS